MKDYYQILGILETASQEDIRQAYLRMALVWHPDRHTGEPPERIAIVTACFQEIGEAYGVLSDPFRKADYDRRRRQIRATPPQRPARPSSSASAPSRPCSSTSETGRRDSSFSRAHNWGTAYGRQTSRAQETSGGRESIADVLGYFFFSLLVVVLLVLGFHFHNRDIAYIVVALFPIVVEEVTTLPVPSSFVFHSLNVYPDLVASVGSVPYAVLYVTVLVALFPVPVHPVVDVILPPFAFAVNVKAFSFTLPYSVVLFEFIV